MEKLSDRELVALIKKHNTRAETILYARYWNYSTGLASKIYSQFKSCCVSMDEYRAICFSSVMIAIEKFSCDNDNFYKFWETISYRECYEYINVNVVNSFTSINKTLSFDETVYEDNESFTNHERISDSVTIEDDNIDKELLKQLIFNPKSKLTNLDIVVAFFFFVKNYSYEDIRKLTGWNIMRIYKRVEAAQKKLSLSIKKDN